MVKKTRTWSCTPPPTHCIKLLIVLGYLLDPGLLVVDVAEELVQRVGLVQLVASRRGQVLDAVVSAKQGCNIFVVKICLTTGLFKYKHDGFLNLWYSKHLIASHKGGKPSWK